MSQSVLFEYKSDLRKWCAVFVTKSKTRALEVRAGQLAFTQPDQLKVETFKRKQTVEAYEKLANEL